MPEIHHISTTDSNFWQRLDSLIAWEGVSSDAVFATVTDIIARIRRHGDEALLDYTKRFDRLDVNVVEELEISRARMQSALESLPSSQRKALELSAERIRVYAQRQALESWQYTEEGGTLLGQQITPLDSVGLYVPGGKASYPSSVLMNAIPAKVAGVPELIMAVPTPDGEVNKMVLAAAAIVGVDRAFAMGGGRKRSRRWLTGLKPYPRWTRSWGQEIFMWPLRNAWFTALSASI